LGTSSELGTGIIRSKAQQAEKQEDLKRF